MNKFISGKKNIIIHVITTLKDNGAQKNLKLFIKETNKQNLFNHVVISLFKPDKSSKVYKELKKMNTKIKKVDLLRDFRFIKSIYKNNYNRKIILFGWMYHGMIYSYFLSKILRIKNRLIWTIRHGEPFHKGISKLTSLLIKILSYIHSFENIPILINSKCGIKNHISIGFKKEKIILWPNFLENKEFNELSLPNSNKKEYFIIYPARYHPQKNHYMSINLINELRSFYKLPFNLFLIGEDIKLLESQIKKENKFSNDTINAIDFIDHSYNIEKYYKKADIVISTSSFGEGLQNIIIEAIYYGKLVFSTNTGDASIILGEEFITKINDFKEMSQKIAEIINNLESKRFQKELKNSHNEKIKKIKTL